MQPLNHIGQHGRPRDRQDPLPDLIPRKEYEFRDVFRVTRSERYIFGLRRKMETAYVLSHYAYHAVKGWLHPAGMQMPIDDKKLWGGRRWFTSSGDFVRYTSDELAALKVRYPEKHFVNELHNPELLRFMIEEFSIPPDEAAGYQAKVAFAWIRSQAWIDREAKRKRRWLNLRRALPSAVSRRLLPPPKK
ncbi:hypothetical protein [uncultured Marivita sp.]|uniref:hypothetical protein n=1 Tax=uncultured Marivita sp. TaxID=888080 RepID=UPI00262AC001|nr:hypothetical protein [uncultured Marivita sp.]